MRRALAPALVALALAAPLRAQGDSARAHDPGKRAGSIGVAATLVPIATGAVLMAAGDADVAGLYTMYGGAVFGPAIGNWSAGLVDRGFTGVGIRAAILAVTIAGPVIACPAFECDDAAGIAAGAIFIAGNAALLAHAAWDLGTLPKRTREHAGLVSIAPTWDALANASGLAMRVEF